MTHAVKRGCLTRSRQARFVEPQAHALLASSRTFPEVTPRDNRIQKPTSPDGCGLNGPRLTAAG